MAADQTTPKIGTILNPDDKGRDAIHIAVAPVTAFEDMWPGEDCGFIEHGNTTDVGACRNGAMKYAVGIVDPFLKEPVRKGQRFYVFLYPGTTTGLRHVWTHPAFAPKAPGKEPA